MGQKFKVTPPIGLHEREVMLGGHGQGWVSLGRLAELGPARPVRLSVDNEHVVAIVGKRGSGKSFTLGTLLEGLCTTEPSTSIGQTDQDHGILLFDTLNIFQWAGAGVPDASNASPLAAQAKALRQWKLEPIPLNVDLWAPAGFEPAGTTNAQSFRIRTHDMEAQDWAALLGTDLIQDRLGQLVFTIMDKVTSRGWQRQDGHAIPARTEYRVADLLECLASDVDVAADYATTTVRALRQRLTAYEASPLFGDDGTPLGQLIRPGRLSVLLLSGVPDDIRLVSMYLTMRKLLAARARASEAGKSLLLGLAHENDKARLQAEVADAPPKAWVVIDEAQNVFPSERQTSASETLLRFVREGRNFGLSLAFTTQQPTALDTRVMAQVDTVVAHTLTVQKDISAILNNLKSPLPQAVKLNAKQTTIPDAIRLLDVGQALVSSVDSARCVFIDVRPRVSVHGGFEG